MKKILTILFFLILNINILYAKNNSNIINKNRIKECIIIKVDDWDTFNLQCINNWDKEYIYNVRTIWVNAPDIILNWKNTKKHCFYDQSKNVIENLKKEKRKIDVEFYGKDLCKDEYKWCRNLVRLIDKKSKIDINKLLIQEWYNFSWINFSMIPLKLKSEYFIAEKIAQKNNKWLWNKCSILYDYKYNYIDSSHPIKMTHLEKKW